MYNIFEDYRVRTFLLICLLIGALVLGMWLDITDHEYIRNFCQLTGNTEMRDETHYDTITIFDSDGNPSFIMIPYHVNVKYYQYHCEDDEGKIHDTWRNYHEDVPQIDLNQLNQY